MGGGLPASAVHIIYVDTRQLSREFAWCKQLELLEKLILRLVLPIVACGVDEQRKGPVPQTACNLRVRDRLSAGREELTKE